MTVQYPRKYSANFNPDSADDKTGKDKETNGFDHSGMDTGTSSQQQKQQQQQQHVSQCQRLENPSTEPVEFKTLVRGPGEGESVEGMSVTCRSSLSINNVEESEVPEDITAFYGHPLTAASHSANGDGLALLHEYQSLPFIDRSTVVMVDTAFATTTTDISQRYVNSLGYDDSLEPTHPTPQPTSVQSSASSVTFSSANEFIRQTPLFDSENLTRGQLGTGEGHSPSSEYQEPVAEMIVEGRNLFSSFEDDAALNYYEHEHDGGEEDFPVDGTVLTYDLEIPQQVGECLDKIRDGHLTGGTTLFHGNITDAKEAILSNIGRGMEIQGTGRETQIIDPLFYNELFVKKRTKSEKSRTVGSIVEGLGVKQTGKKRLVGGTGNSRKRKVLNALPGNSQPSTGTEFYGGVVDGHSQTLKSSLSKYELNPVLGSTVHQTEHFSSQASGNALSIAFANHGTLEGYQSPLAYLDTEYQTLLASEDLRMGSLNGHKVQAGNPSELDYHREDISPDMWQTNFLTDDFHLTSSTAGCYSQSQSPGGIQWCTISNPDFQTISCSSQPGTNYTSSTRQSTILTPSPQHSRMPWNRSTADVSSPSNTPLDMSASIYDSHNNSLHQTQLNLQTPRFSIPVQSNINRASDKRLEKATTQAKTPRQRRKQTQSQSTEGMTPVVEPVDAGLLGLQAISAEGPTGFLLRRKPQDSYGSHGVPEQRQMPGLIPSNLLNYTDPLLQQTDRTTLTLPDRSNNLLSIHPGVEREVNPSHLHQIRLGPPVHEGTNPGESRIAPNSVNSLQESSTSGQMSSNAPEAASMPSLPFPIPAVPPGYRLVITHHPLPSENDKEPQHITQLIIDNPRTSYQTTNNQAPPVFKPTLPPQTTGLDHETTNASQVVEPNDVSRDLRPSTLEFLPQANSHSIPGHLSSDGSDPKLHFPSLKHEPQSPMDSVMAGSASTFQTGNFITSPSTRLCERPGHHPTVPVDLLELSMREAKVMAAAAAPASNRSQSTERPVFLTSSSRQDSLGGSIGESGSRSSLLPLSAGSSCASTGDVFPVGDSLVPLNLTGCKPVVVTPGSVPSFQFEINNNSLPSVHSDGGVGASSGSTTPTGVQSWYRMPQGHDLDGSGLLLGDISTPTVPRESSFPPAHETTTPGLINQRRVSSSSTASRKAVRNRSLSARRSKSSTIDKIDPDLSGYEFFLDAPISTKVRCDEDRVTYLNKGQYYSLFFKFDPTQEIDFVNKNTPVKSVVMVLFRDRQSFEEELKAWEFWHSRQHSLKQRVLDVDGKNFGDADVPVSVDEIAFNAVSVVWKRQDKPVKVNIALNCLSTDFSHQKGVKGNPLHIQIDTFADDTESSALVHRAYCQIKVFCDKGADRKSREEERKRTKSTESDISEERHHDPCERSFFYRMTDTTTPPVLFTPTNSLATKICTKDSSFSLEPLAVDKRLGSLDGDSSSSVPAKRPKSCTFDQHKVPQRILLYAREETDDVFTALMLESPTVSSLLQAIQEKFNVPVTAIRNIYNRSRKSVTVRIDDNVVRHFSNESTFIISIDQLPQKPVANDYDSEEQSTASTYYDVTLAEIQP